MNAKAGIKCCAQGARNTPYRYESLSVYMEQE